MLKVSSNTGVVITLTVVVFLGCCALMSSCVLVVTTFVKSVLSVKFVLLLTEGVQGVTALLINKVVVNCVYSTMASFMIAFTRSSSVIGLRN